MPEKLFNAEVLEIQKLEQQARQLTSDRDEKAAKAELLSGEVFTLRKRRDDLEKVISNASMLILEGKLSEEAYIEGKKELSSLYGDIDSKDELFNMYDKACNEEFVKRSSEVQGSIKNKRSILLSKYSKKIAYDIINTCGLQVKQLLAITPTPPMAIDSSWKSTALGKALIYAIEHDSDGPLCQYDLRHLPLGN